jgi:Uma2 family endonuclease
MYQYRRGEYVTLDQYQRLVEDDRFRSELSRGMLVREPRPGALHSRIAFELAVILRDYVNANDLGRVEVEAGYRLSEQPPSVRGPDVSFISRERLPADVPVSWWPFAPDLAVEVVSPGNKVAAVQQKILDYFDAGTRQIWLVDAASRSITVYRSLSDIRIIRAPDVLVADDIFPGFELALDALLMY